MPELTRWSSPRQTMLAAVCPHLPVNKGATHSKFSATLRAQKARSMARGRFDERMIAWAAWGIQICPC